MKEVQTRRPGVTCADECVAGELRRLAIAGMFDRDHVVQRRIDCLWRFLDYRQPVFVLQNGDEAGHRQILRPKVALLKIALVRRQLLLQALLRNGLIQVLLDVGANPRDLPGNRSASL